MNITADKVPTLNYTLKDDEGVIIDESKDASFVYLHGHSNIIPGLEAALQDRTKGDTFSLVLEPKDAYGEYNPKITQTIPKDAFGGESVEVGMQFHAENDNGQQVLITISEINGDDVTIDGNPPLAGVTLHYDVEVVDVRDATTEELDHGHVHAHGQGCGHDH